MSLSRVREKYPEFANMSDQELADSLYESHYAGKISKDDYYKRLGLSPKSKSSGSKGLYGVAEDIGDTVTKLPSDVMSLLKALPGQLKESGKQAVRDPSRAYANIGAGVGEGLIGALNIPSNISAYLEKKGIVSPETNKSMQKLHIGDLGFEKAIGLDDQQPGDELLRGVGSFMPYARVGALAKGVGGVAKRGAAAAAYGAGQNQDPLQAALLGYIGEKGVKAAGQIPNLVPSKALRGNLSPQELEANLRATQGTETGLGDVLENPKLKQFVENQAGSFPYSGADEAMGRTAKEIQSRSNKAVDGLLQGQPPENVGETLVGGLQKASEEATTIKNQKWGKVNELAEKHDVTTTRDSLRDEARSALSQIQRDADLASFRDGEEINLLKKLAKLGEKTSQNTGIVSVITGQPITIPLEKKLFGLKDTEFLKSELGERAYDAFVNNDKPKAKLYGNLKKALESDINSAIDDSGVPELKKARDDALDYHKNEFVDFEDPDIMKFTRRNADPDTIVQYFLRTGRLTDRANLLKKIQSKLPQEHQGLLPYAYLSSAMKEGNINPNTLRTLYNKLGARQKDVLFPDKGRMREFEDLNSLVGKNQEALQLMSNPKTGWRIGNALQNALQLGTAAVAGTHGGVPAAIAGGAAAHFLPGLVMKPFVKLLTNQGFRESLVKKMLEREPKRNLQREALIQSLIDRSAGASPMLTIPVNQYKGVQSQEGSQ